jgi:hypothetical protein
VPITMSGVAAEQPFIAVKRRTVPDPEPSASALQSRH